MFFSQALSGPIVKLRRGAEQIMQGNWEHNVAVSSRDEVGDLSRVFSKMASTLHKTQEELQDYSAKLEKKGHVDAAACGERREMFKKIIVDEDGDHSGSWYAGHDSGAFNQMREDAKVIVNKDRTLVYHTILGSHIVDVRFSEEEYIALEKMAGTAAE